MTEPHDSEQADTPHDVGSVQVLRTIGTIAIGLGAALSVLTISVSWQDVPREWLALYLVVVLAGVGIRIEAAIRDHAR
ncbi:hypothetical protein [Nonomuraea sp. NPDC002799]